MNLSNNISYDDFEKSLPAGYLKTLQIISLAIGAGIVMFLFVVVILYSTTTQPQLQPSEETESILSLAHAVIFISTFFLSRFIYGMIISGKMNQLQNLNQYSRQKSSENDFNMLLQKIRTAEIVRLALLEAPAMFGLVVILICVTSGVIFYEPVYWLNFLSGVVLWGMIYINFPTKDKLFETMRSYYSK
jgi:hypothetical protein